MRRVNLLRGHGSPTLYQYAVNKCRCVSCRSAKKADHRRHYLSNAESIRATRRQYRVDHHDTVIARERKYYATHREERNASSRKYYADNVEEQTAWQRQYYAEHSEELRMWARAYYREHQEHYLDYAAQYRQSHREQMRTWARNRLAREKDADGTHTSEDIEAQYARQRGKCFWRSVNEDCTVSLKDGYHVDHVVPLSKGGSNGPENLVLACPTCNLQKHAKHPMEWSGQLF